MANRPLDKITWPVSEEMIEAINDNFDKVFQDLANHAIVVTQSMTMGIFPITVPNGGTYITSYAIGDLIYASAATTLSKLADVAVGKYLRSGGVATAPLWSTLTLPNAAVKGDVLIATDTNVIGSVVDVALYRTLHSGGVGAIPTWSLVDLATDCTGALDATQGGTEQTAVATGDLLYGSATNTWSRLGAGQNGRYLRGTTGAAPSWSTLVLPNVMTTGDLFVATTTNTGGSITAVTAGKLLRSAGTSTVPAYSTFTIPDTFAKGDIPTATSTNILGVIAPGTAAYVLTSNGAGAAASFQAVPAVAHVMLSTTHTDTLADTVIRGDVLYGNATPKWARLAFAANSILGSNATDVLWLTDIPTAVTIGTKYIYRADGTDVPVADGGTGASTFTAYSVICAGTTATGAFQNAVGVGNSGEVLTSAGAGALPAWAALGAWAAHDLLSATHGDTLASAVSRGSLIYGNSTPKWAELAVGASAGMFLRTDSSDVMWSTLILPNAATQYRVPYATAANTWGESANLTFNGTTLFANTIVAGATAASTTAGDLTVARSATTGVIWLGSDAGVYLYRTAATATSLIGTDFALDAQKKQYYDGGGNTYIWESSADNLTFVVGGTSIVTYYASGMLLNTGGFLMNAWPTTVNAANLYAVNADAIRIGVSLRAYKRDIRAISIAEARRVVIGMTGVLYRSRIDTDDQHRSWPGFIADDLEGITQDLVTYDHGVLQSVMYDRVPVYHSVLLQDHESRLQRLEKSVC